MKGEIDKSTIIIGDFKTPLIAIERPIRQKISSDIDALQNTTDQLILIDICITIHPTTTEYTFFFSAHGIFRKKGHNSHLNKFKIMYIIQYMFLKCNIIKPEHNNRKISGKFPNI